MKKVLAFVIVALLFCVPFILGAKDFPKKDDVVVSSVPAQNYGNSAATTVGTGTSGSSPNQRTYQLYNLSNITGTFTAVNLSIRTASVYGGVVCADGANTTITAHYCDDNNWGETTITWNTQATEVQNCINNTFLVNVTCNSLVDDTRYDFTSSLLVGYINNDTDKVFTILWEQEPISYSISSNYINFYSRNNTDNYSNMPEIQFLTTGGVPAAPTISVNAPANNTDTNHRLNVNFTVTDNDTVNTSCDLYMNSAKVLSNASVANNTLTTFSPTWTIGANTWYLNCTDGTTIVRTGTYNYAYTRTLTIVPTSPANDTETGNSHLPVNFSAQDNLFTTFACTLRVDNNTFSTNTTTANNTATSVATTWSKGSHHWQINCSDTELTAQTGLYDIIFNSSLAVLTSAPLNNTRTNTNDLVSYEVYDTNHANDSCTLYIDNLLNASQNTLNDTVTTFSPIWSQGVHFWYINCTDGLDNATSGVFAFDYDTSAPFINSFLPVSANTTIYANGTMLVQGNVTDNTLFRVNRTISYPNGTVFYNNYSGDIPPLTTFYSWSDSFNTSTLPNGIYRLFIAAADSHTAQFFEPALAVINDVPTKTLTYELAFDTVTIQLIGGDADQIVLNDIPTEKLDDRYTFGFAFADALQQDSTAIFRVTSTQPIIYLPDSDYKAHMVLANKYWLDFENYNGDATVEKVDDYTYDVTLTVTVPVEVRPPICTGGINNRHCSLEQRTSIPLTGLQFNSLGGLNEANLSISFQIGNCVPNYICAGYTACGINDTAACNSTTDLNSCSIPYAGDFSEFTAQTCNYCTQIYVIENISACVSGISTLCYNNTNFATCCNVTHKSPDCLANLQQIYCIPNYPCSAFEYTSSDIAPATINAFATATIALVAMAGLIVLLLIITGIFKRLRK